MKNKNWPLATMVMVAAFAAGAQNQPPQITNLRAIANKPAQEVLISYDLVDPDNSKIAIELAAIHDGRSVSLTQMRVSGNVGFPVTPGKSRQIIWHYADSLTDVERYTINLIADDRETADIKTMVSAVNPKNIHKDVVEISKTRFYEQNPTSVADTKKAILQNFKDKGLKARRQEFSYGNYKAHNIIGVQEGLGGDNHVFIIGAHFDAVKGSPGANDNASGIAGMLEIMRVLSQYLFYHSIHFVAFDLEEIDLLGSKEYVRFLSDSSGTKISGMINFDMIGYVDEKPGSQVFPEELKDIFPEAYASISADGFKGNFILNTSNETSAQLSSTFDTCAAKYTPQLKVISIIVPDNGNFAPEAFRASDHVGFWDANYSAISIGDTGNVRDPFYHSPDDKPETVNYVFVTDVVKASVGTLAELAIPIHGTTARCQVDVQKP